MNWKAILGSVAGVLVIILQLINVILSSDIDSTLLQKTDLLQQNAARLQENAKNLQSIVDSKAAFFEDRANGIERKLDDTEKTIKSLMPKQ